MKLAILHPFQFRHTRGIERFTWDLAGALARRGVAVDLLTWRWPRPVRWGALPAGVHVRQMQHFRFFMARLAIPYYLYWLARGRYDWVLVFFANYGEAEALALAQKLGGQRCCAVFHFPRQQVPHRYAEFARSGLAARADRLVAVSHYVAEGVEAQFGRPCAVIGNGVDGAVFRPAPELRAAIRRQMGVPPEAPVLISLAALEERKGVQWVIRALPRLLPEFPDLRYWVLGAGPHRAALEDEIRALGLQAQVTLLGSREDVAPFLAGADVGCFLAYGESFGMALIEYLAMELPVLSSCHPPFPELMQPAWGDMVVETDVAAVAACLGALLRDPARRLAMGRAGRQQVLRQHTWERVADGYLDLLAGPARAAPCDSIHQTLP